MPGLNVNEIREASDTTVVDGKNMIIGVYTAFNLTPPPFNIKKEDSKIQFHHNEKLFDAYYFHPDHLGSSSYITNRDGEVSQHMEYLPFGETLADEHLNSYNSPFKFNGKEIDEETGNYYYSARYYDPKMSIFISVDSLAEKYPEWSSYAYTFNNPVIYVDPDGKEGEYIDPSKLMLSQEYAEAFIQFAKSKEGKESWRIMLQRDKN